jgi:hypothetical protein
MRFLTNFVSQRHPLLGAFGFQPTNGAGFAMKMDRGLDDELLIGRPRFETGQCQSRGIVIVKNSWFMRNEITPACKSGRFCLILALIYTQKFL